MPGLEFQDSVSAGGAEPVLNGLGLRKATFLNVKVNVAGLCLPQKSSDAGQILGSGQDWRLALSFLRDVDAADMQEAFAEGFEGTGADLAPLQARIDAFEGMLVDFEGGQSVWFTNHPASGVEVAVDGAARCRPSQPVTWGSRSPQGPWRRKVHEVQIQPPQSSFFPRPAPQACVGPAARPQELGAATSRSGVSRLARPVSRIFRPGFGRPRPICMVNSRLCGAQFGAAMG